MRNECREVLGGLKWLEYTTLWSKFLSAIFRQQMLHIRHIAESQISTFGLNKWNMTKYHDFHRLRQNSDTIWDVKKYLAFLSSLSVTQHREKKKNFGAHPSGTPNIAIRTKNIKIFEISDFLRSDICAWWVSNQHSFGLVRQPYWQGILCEKEIFVRQK